MRAATVDGLVTLFYDGSKELYNWELHYEWFEKYEYDDAIDADWENWEISDRCKRYWKERQSWQQVIVVEGVTVIPEMTFHRCENIKRVIMMADTLIRIERNAFYCCFNLVYIKLSINLEYIGVGSFGYCDLSSVFIPPSCREIAGYAFNENKNLTIFNVSQHTAIGEDIIKRTKLLQDSPFELDRWGNYHNQSEEVNNWLKNMNNDDKYSLHRACTSFQPLKEVYFAIIKTKGITAFAVKNEAGITPSQYLKENPYADIEEMDIVREFVMKMMGEYN